MSSELWICREQTADKPFCVESLDLELHNLEELCYFLYENAMFLEEGLMGEPLFAWIREELGLPRLAELLAEHRKQGKNDIWCAWFFLQEIGMYDSQELVPIRQMSKELSGRGSFWRRKLAADQLLRNERYNRCILEYERLLKGREALDQEPELLGDIHHNLGVAYAGLFLLREAANQFALAYEQNQRAQSLQAKENALLLLQPLEITQEWEEPQDWGVHLLELREEYKKKVM
ncbi:MAG: hypothetical protein HFI42_09260 [Lachnospiraceae bacterium]|nr:hypothetical protein [Lachnospiraceae bacterium]MCI9150662.1 hypothetical protein [Lachnospiraceae bacterium]